jgi:gliding motility-associated lipoprotein GldH
MRISLFLILLFAIFTSCDSKRIYEASMDIGEDGWRETQVLEYKFEVQEASQPYNIFYTVRYSNNYPNYNLYVKDYIADTSGKVLLEKLQGMDLFKPTTGAPYGSGFGGNLDYTILGLSNFKFPHKGLFTIKVKQYMRQDPLKGILAFGIRLEKYNPK